MSLIKPFYVKLTDAQYILLRAALKEAEGMGDCRVVLRRSIWCMEFTDYEGVQATIRKLMGVRTVTARAVRSWDAVKGKIDAGVKGALKQ